MKAVITKSQYNKIKNFINETKEVKKDEILDEKRKKKLSKKQLDTFDIDNDGDIEADDMADLRNMKKISKKELEESNKKYPWDECIADAKKRYGSLKKAEKICGSIKAKSRMQEGSDCGCGGSDEHNDTRYMFFSNLEQMMRQARMLLQMDEDMIEDLLNNGHDWAADHIAEAKNNMDQVFDFITGEMHGEGEDDDWDSDEEEREMVYESMSLKKKLSFLKN